jgi:hypothetical protein
MPSFNSTNGVTTIDINDVTWRREGGRLYWNDKSIDESKLTEEDAAHVATQFCNGRWWCFACGCALCTACLSCIPFCCLNRGAAAAKKDLTYACAGEAAPLRN